MMNETNKFIYRPTLAQHYLLLGWGKSLFLIAIALSLIGTLGRWHRLPELASHFRVQYTLASLACLLVFVIIRASAGWTACALLASIITAASLAPWYISGRANVLPDDAALRHIKLLLSNVNYGNDNYAALLQLIQMEDPDVVVCQEVTENWERQLTALYAAYPYHLSVPRPGGSGIALLSRLPLPESKILDLGIEGRPGILARIDVGGEAVTLLTLHPPTPLEEANFRARNRQLLEAAEVMNSRAGRKILLGDLNTSVWSPYLTDLQQRSGMVDARKGRGVLPSWPTQLPPFCRIPINQCLVSPSLSINEIRTGPQTGSDHLPLIVKLSF